MSGLTATAVPVSPRDVVNEAILSVSEDQLRGFWRDPVGEISARTGIDDQVVIERLRAMLEAGTLRRIRQTLLATNLAAGALIAWKVPEYRLEEAFDLLLRSDPFTGHIVIRSSDQASSAAEYRLWTTLKVPKPYSIEEHCDILAGRIGALGYRIMPALREFLLGVGHMRRKQMAVGEKADEPATARIPAVVDLDELEWRVLLELKRELAPGEIVRDLWRGRARQAGVDLETFCSVAERLNERGVIGRFSTFLEHVKPVAGQERLTRFNALFHWAIAPGQEIAAGREIGRFRILTHCYWRDGGPQLDGVNIMAVAHGEDRASVMAHKAAIDEHLRQQGIACRWSNVFWGGRSEVRPSEISPAAYADWYRHNAEEMPAAVRRQEIIQ
jgi:DNA-binding Lrp family transcriptional regulator